MMARMMAMRFSAAIGIFSLIFKHCVSAEDVFPSCGSCWCVPDDGGTAFCPDTKPQTTFDQETIDGFEEKVPESIYSLDCNPYKVESCAVSPPQKYLELGSDAVCAIVYPESGSCSSYNLTTFSSRTAFENDPRNSRAILTHEGSCGLCSTAQDLAVYLFEDFTTAGKKCASIGLFNESAGLLCYEEIGLTHECAKIWNFDGIYDGSECLGPCISNLVAPNNGPPPACTLNPCLECDEVEAGPLFSSMGGRTRRRSGLLSEIVRNCSSIAQGIIHDPALSCTPAAVP